MITVFGSLNSDFILEVKNFPVAGETVLCPSYLVKAGGKGANQAVAASLAGAEVSMFGEIGKDNFGLLVKNKLILEGVDVSGIVEGQNPTAVAVVMVDETSENSIVVASGANLFAKSESVPKEALTKNNVLVLQMEVNHNENFKLLKQAKKNGAKTILNVAPFGNVPEDVLKNIDYIIVNEIEAQMFANNYGIDASDVVEIAKFLANKSNGVCIVTLGSSGAIAATSEDVLKIDSMQITPVDTTGAGDAFVGIFAAAIDEGIALDEALRRASVGSALACLALGAQESLPKKEDIEKSVANIKKAYRI